MKKRRRPRKGCYSASVNNTQWPTVSWDFYSLRSNIFSSNFPPQMFFFVALKLSPWLYLILYYLLQSKLISIPLSLASITCDLNSFRKYIEHHLLLISVLLPLASFYHCQMPSDEERNVATPNLKKKIKNNIIVLTLKRLEKCWIFRNSQ